VEYYSGTITSSGMVVQVIRPIYAQDALYDSAIEMNGSVNMAYAFGYTDSLTQHTTSDRQLITINFATGTTSQIWTVDDILRVVHGVTMFTSWGLLLLFGMLWARFSRKVELKINGTPAWFYVHRITQYTGFILCIIGWIIAIVMVQVHYNTLFHAQLGTAVIGLAIIQVFFGYYRPHPTVQGVKTTIRKVFEFQHLWTGRLALLLSIPVIASGLQEINAPFAAFIAYLICVSIIVIIACFFEIYLSISEHCFDTRNAKKIELVSLNQDMSESNSSTQQPLSSTDMTTPSNSPPKSLRKHAMTPTSSTATTPIPSPSPIFVPYSKHARLTITPNPDPTIFSPPPISPYTRSTLVPPSRVVLPAGSFVQSERVSDESSEEEVSVNVGPVTPVPLGQPPHSVVQEEMKHLDT
jgi:hypothetical protein